MIMLVIIYAIVYFDIIDLIEIALLSGILCLPSSPIPYLAHVLPRGRRVSRRNSGPGENRIQDPGEHRIFGFVIVLQLVFSINWPWMSRRMGTTFAAPLLYG